MILDGANPKHMNILLVEDNQDNADLFVRILKTANYEITHTLRGLEGLKLARQQAFSVILLDYDLPDINGMQVCIALRKFLKTTPIIALTAKADRTTREQARLSGFDAFITKPCLDKDLLQTIQTTVEQVEAQNAKVATEAQAMIEAKLLAELKAKAAALKSEGDGSSAINPIDIQTALEAAPIDITTPSTLATSAEPSTLAPLTPPVEPTPAPAEAKAV